MTEETSTDPFAEANVVYSYTRAQALEDGTLADVTAIALDVGFQHPAAIASYLWADIADSARRQQREPMDVAKEVLAHCRDMLVRAREEGAPPSDRLEISWGGGPLIMHCGPGDDPRPVLTFMRPLDD